MSPQLCERKAQPRGASPVPDVESVFHFSVFSHHDNLTLRKSLKLTLAETRNESRAMRTMKKRLRRSLESSKRQSADIAASNRAQVKWTTSCTIIQLHGYNRNRHTADQRTTSSNDDVALDSTRTARNQSSKLCGKFRHFERACRSKVVTYTTGGATCISQLPFTPPEGVTYSLTQLPEGATQSIGYNQRQ